MKDSVWTEKRVAKLLALWPDKSLSVAMIGQRLGVSGAAVSGKVKRLGIANRPSPIQPRLPLLANSLPAVLGKRGPVAKTTLPTLESCPGEYVEPASLPSRNKACCWPITDESPWLFCDQPTVNGNRYCPAHRRVSMFGSGGAAEMSRAVPPTDEIPAATGETLQFSGESPKRAVTISSASESSEDVENANIIPPHENTRELAAVV